MDIETLRTIFGYNRWVNTMLFDLAAKITPEQTRDSYGASFDSIHGTLAHMLGGEIVWFNRWTGSQVPPAPADSLPDIQSIRNRWDEHQKDIDTFLHDATTTRLNETLRWTGRDGVSYQAPLWQSVYQVLNHSTHHRSELCDMLTRAGFPPPPTDFIAMYQKPAA